jgi:hypothetical protein
MKKEDKEYEIKWWKDWLEANYLKRENMVKKLPIVKEILSMDNVPKKIRKHSFALMLNSFFEDLESAVYTKIRLEKGKIKNKS